MPDWLRTGIAAIAIIGAIGGGGYLAVTQLGWESTLELLGFQVNTVLTAPESQCNRARDQASADESITCKPDRDWLAQFYERCGAGEETGLVYVGETGALDAIGKCPIQVRAAARKRAREPIPRDYRVADMVEGLAN